MYKVAAYWAYAPAAHKLAVMYYRGQGVRADRPLGAAWMVIAVEQGSRRYALARDQMVTLLTHAEFAEAGRLFGQLHPKYGEQMAMRRAKAQWAYARSQKTGSCVGGDAGEPWVGAMDTGHTPVSLMPNGQPIKMTTTAAGLLHDGSVPGSSAYQQFQQSTNPYSVEFLESREGNATVGPLQEMRQPAVKPKAAADGQQPSTSSQPVA